MIQREIDEAERIDWIRLSRTPRVGPVTFFQLIGKFGSAANALAELPRLVRKGGAPKPPSKDLVVKEIEDTRSYGARIVCAIEPAYPKLLSALQSPPPALTTLGNLKLAQKESVAMVGARDASAAGRKLARDMSALLSSAGFTTVSGLARGIDGEVHAASLSGGTVAVLGGGVDHIYPTQHDRLYAAIAEQGLIVSESPFGYRAQARDFPRRNRIITGMASGVVVVEAAERSGSLISARTAGEQGREVMAIPGSPLDPRSAGTNRLLREGATLVRNAEDVIEALSSIIGGGVKAPDRPNYEFDEEDGQIPVAQIEAVLSALGPSPMPIDDIARVAKIGSGRCAAILVELELSGKAMTLSGGLACRAF